MATIRNRFRRGQEYVVTAPLKLADKVALKPGDIIDSFEFSTRQLRSLYRRKRIGIRGSFWAESMIKRYMDRQKQATIRSIRILVDKTRKDARTVAALQPRASVQIDISLKNQKDAVDNALSIVENLKKNSKQSTKKENK